MKPITITFEQDAHETSILTPEWADMHFKQFGQWAGERLAPRIGEVGYLPGMSSTEKAAFKVRATFEIIHEQEEPAKDSKEVSMAELKATASELGLEFKGNISRAELTELIEDAQTAPGV